MQTAINAASGDLPKNLLHPPTFEKASPADVLLMIIAVYSDAMPIGNADDYVESYFAPRSRASMAWVWSNTVVSRSRQSGCVSIRRRLLRSG